MKLLGHEGTVFTVAVSSDGRTVLSGSGDKTIRCAHEGYTSVDAAWDVLTMLENPSSLGLVTGCGTLRPGLRRPGF